MPMAIAPDGIIIKLVDAVRTHDIQNHNLTL